MNKTAIVGSKAVCTVSGGTPSYTWSVADIALGSIDSSSGSSVTYTRNNSGNNTVRVTDAAGNSASVVIVQP